VGIIWWQIGNTWNRGGKTHNNKNRMKYIRCKCMINLKLTISFSILLLLLSTSVLADAIIETFSGSGMHTTKSFSVDDEWEVQWTSDLDDFQIYLFRADGTGTGKKLRIGGTALGITANPLYFGEGTSRQKKGGEYYFKINTRSNWNINVFQLSVTAPVKKPKRSATNKSNKPDELKKDDTLDEGQKQQVVPPHVYHESRTVKPSGKIYDINSMITLHNTSDAVVAIYRSETLYKITDIFKNSNKVAVTRINVKPDTYPAEIKVHALLKDGSEFNDWIPKDKLLGDIKNIFANGIRAKIVDYKGLPNKPVVYKVLISLQDKREYTGWISEGVIRNETDIQKAVEQTNNSGPSVDCREHIELHSASYIANEYGESEFWVLENRKIYLWEKLTSQGKGKVVGKMLIGSRALILEKSGEDYKVQSPLDKSIGWVNEVQVARTLLQNTETREPCTSD
jgi:hypothetical protein